MPPSPLDPAAHALRLWLFVAGTVLASGGLVTVAALVPPPPAVIPFVVLAAIGMPMLAALQLPGAIAALRRAAWETRLRRDLGRIPETEHPLGL
jgi:hypothetical protein